MYLEKKRNKTFETYQLLSRKKHNWESLEMFHSVLNELAARFNLRTKGNKSNSQFVLKIRASRTHVLGTESHQKIPHRSYHGDAMWIDSSSTISNLLIGKLKHTFGAQWVRLTPIDTDDGQFRDDWTNPLKLLVEMKATLCSKEWLIEAAFTLNEGCRT